MPHAVFQLEEFLEVAVERLDALSPAAVEPSALLAGEERRPFLAMQPLALASAPLHASPPPRVSPPRLPPADVGAFRWSGRRTRTPGARPRVFVGAHFASPSPRGAGGGGGVGGGAGVSGGAGNPPHPRPPEHFRLTLFEEPPLAGFALSPVGDGDDNEHRDLPFLIFW